ncbi:MAG: succinate dehydrogenase assembly factor 2 [Hyphomicrobiales bacterium]|nr:succinate dehydrogenase assembly factor 2 [Hyphomicrobiales bacterium]MBV9138140.1 succinate dehydrogenase assembly factor 2 [Hyphomicrobiales bacterium]MBV9588782.1 succinate dehydrogenase assembly factor 2 [Hyphomicrobiales bacterium]MBV9975618.1 succinate dehydrogenase assembly factor 2 [Hyphomicrobiales bacterium]
MHSETEIRRRRLRFRAWHRGIREMDLLMGGFADARLQGLDERELGLFEELLELPDQEVFTWLTGQAPVPKDHDTSLFRQLKSFYDHARPLHV